MLNFLMRKNGWATQGDSLGVRYRASRMKLIVRLGQIGVMYIISWFDIIVAMLGGEMYSFPGPIDRPTRIRLPILPNQYLLGDTVVTSETRSWRIQKFSCCKRQESRCLFFRQRPIEYVS
jgi:hypothetical protein